MEEWLMIPETSGFPCFSPNPSPIKAGAGGVSEPKPEIRPGQGCMGTDCMFLFCQWGLGVEVGVRALGSFHSSVT